MKIRNSWIFAVLFLLCIAAGCTSAKAESAQAADEGEEIAAASGYATAVITEEVEQEGISGSGESLNGEPDGEMSRVPRKLAESELQDFSQWINAEENYTFLLSEYEDSSQMEEARLEYNENEEPVLFVCVGGREIEDGKYELDCVPEGVRPGFLVRSCQLILEKDGGGFPYSVKQIHG